MRRVLVPIAGVVAAVILYLVGSFWNGGAPERVEPVLPGNEGAVAPAPRPARSTGEVLSPAKPAHPLGVAAPVDAPETTLFGSSPGDLLLLAAKADAFLAQRGESAFNLLAAFTATQDPRFLERALAKFPNDPAVLLVALESAKKGPEIAGLIARLKVADPNNPIPWVFSAANLFEEGNVPEAVEELRAALKRPAFYSYFMERAAALRELARFSGASEFASESLGYFAQPVLHLSGAMKVSRELQALVKAQSAVENQAGVSANVKLLFDVAKMFQTPEASRLLIGQMVGQAMERKALELAQNLPASEAPLAPESRAAELDKMKDEAKNLASVAARVYAEPPLWKEYFERFRTEGELAALRWVNQQPVSVTDSSAYPPRLPNGVLRAP